MVKELDTTLAALADPTRRQVVDWLQVGPRRAGELARRAGMSSPAMSRHLRVLRSSGLVAAEGSEKDARLRVYRLQRAPFASLQGWLTQVESFWAGQLDAFREHVERTRPASRPPGAKDRR